MEKFQLQVFLNLIGIGAASGLFFDDDSLLIIADNSTYLYEYQFNTKLTSKIPLVENPAENIPKKDKLDFEVITKKNNKIHILGSGSKANRNEKMVYNLKNQKVKQKNNAKLYAAFNKIAALDKEELNIEGCFITTDFSYYFQRGNGKQQRNGIFKVSNSNKKKINFTPIILPKIKNEITTFTDAILVEDKIYFLATAEASNSTYLDGEILGTLIGALDLNTFQLENYTLISDNQKFEGITLFSNSDAEIHFLICEDNDKNEAETKIYKLILSK
jgi:hypothetical protein